MGRKKLRIKIKCQQCDKEFEVIPSRKKQKFCTHKCCLKFQVGENNPNYGNHPIPWNTGLKYTEEDKKRYKQMGRPAGFISEKRLPKIKKKCIICGTNFEVHPCRNKTAKFCSIKCISKGRKHTLKHVQDSLRKRIWNNGMSKKEEQFMNLLNQLNLNYEFVGDGRLIIDRYCPDFKHKTKKKLIELCNYRQERINKKTRAYKKEGWECLFVINNEKGHPLKIIERIIKFTDN